MQLISSQNAKAMQVALPHSSTPILSWQQQLREVVTDYRELCQLLNLSETELEIATLASIKQFPLRVPRAFLQRIKQGDPLDPLLRQVLPLGQEQLSVPGFVQDALQEQRFNPVPGVLHKYPNRVLLTVTSACAVHCRYCFRRHFPYEENTPSRQGWEPAFNYIRQHAEIEEVILSGGDPLSMRDERLFEMLDKLQEIPHVRLLRLHSRFPIVIPQRITDELCAYFQACRLPIVLVLHCNHAQEIDAGLASALQKLRLPNVTLLNQSVLLQGVNDSVATLVALSKRLFEVGILPYYLHCLDPVAGTAHFSIPRSRAIELWQQMRDCLSGYLVPRLVEEIPGKQAKQVVTILESNID